MRDDLIEIAPLSDAEAEAAFCALIETLDRMGCTPAATVADKADEGVSFSLHFSANRARKLIAARALSTSEPVSERMRKALTNLVAAIETEPDEFGLSYETVDALMDARSCLAALTQGDGQ